MTTILFLDALVGSYSLYDDNLLSLAGHYRKELKSKTVDVSFAYKRFPEDFIPDPELLWWAGFVPETWDPLGDGEFSVRTRAFFDENKIRPNVPVICFDAVQLKAAMANAKLVLPVREPLGVRDYYMVLANRKLVPIIENPTLMDIADFFSISYEYPLGPGRRLDLLEQVYTEVIKFFDNPLTNQEE